MFRIHWGRMIGKRMRGMRPALRRVTSVGALTVVAVLAFATSALAVTGTRIHVAELARSHSPAVAVDAAGTAYIAWSNDLRPPKEGDTLEYCVLPAGATACTFRNHLRLESGEEPFIGEIKVLVDGTTVVLLATDVFGVGSNKYEPVQEWQSTNSGASFTKVIGGKSVANYGGSADNPVIVPGTNALGIGAGEPSFDEFPLSPSSECSAGSCPESPFATLQSSTSKIEHPGFADLGGSFASDLIPGQQGVLGVYPTFSRQNQCNGESSAVTDYVYGQGAQEPNNSYDIAPGHPKSAWKKELSPGGCEVTNVTAAGGPSGLGVVENDKTRGYTVYQRFNQTTEEFEPAYSTITTEEESQPSLSQDGAGGVYLAYDTFYGVNLAYSSTGGGSWTGPAQIVSEQFGVSNLSSAVGSGGQGWAVWTREESIYAQQFVASDAIPPPAPPPSAKQTTPPPPPAPNSSYTIQSITSNSNGTVTITFVPTQSGAATLVVTVPTASIASTSATIAKAKKCKKGQIKIRGKCRPSSTVAGKVSASGVAGVPLKLTVNLSSKIKALLKKGKTVHLTATLTYTSSLGGAQTVHVYHLTVKGKKTRHPRKH
jgi:hypothetical protein